MPDLTAEVVRKIYSFKVTVSAFRIYRSESQLAESAIILRRKKSIAIFFGQKVQRDLPVILISLLRLVK